MSAAERTLPRAGDRGRRPREAWVVGKGGRVAVLQADVMVGDTKVAVATGTFYIQTVPQA